MFEAIASRSPIVCTDHPMFRSVLHDGKNCAMFSSGDVDGFAGAMRRVIEFARSVSKVVEQRGARPGQRCVVPRTGEHCWSSGSSKGRDRLGLQTIALSRKKIAFDFMRQAGPRQASVLHDPEMLVGRCAPLSVKHAHVSTAFPRLDLSCSGGKFRRDLRFYGRRGTTCQPPRFRHFCNGHGGDDDHQRIHAVRAREILDA